MLQQRRLRSELKWRIPRVHAPGHRRQEHTHPRRSCASAGDWPTGDYPGQRARAALGILYIRRDVLPAQCSFSGQSSRRTDDNDQLFRAKRVRLRRDGREPARAWSHVWIGGLRRFRWKQGCRYEDRCRCRAEGAMDLSNWRAAGRTSCGAEYNYGRWNTHQSSGPILLDGSKVSRRVQEAERSPLKNGQASSTLATLVKLVCITE